MAKNRSSLKSVYIITGILVWFLFSFVWDVYPENPLVGKTLGIALLMAIWWVTEAIPIAATALVPVVLFPLTGVVDGKTISGMYFNHLIFLFIGGFIMALAMQRWNLHKRIALKLLLWVGMSPGRILFGFMFASYFLSMWMSNTATAMLMISILIPIIQRLRQNLSKEELGRFPIALLLGIAYASSVGGISTLVGTPPNLSFARISTILFPNMPEISFAQWMLFALPISILIFIVVWALLYGLFKPKVAWKRSNKSEIQDEYTELGKFKPEEKIILILFTLMALLWIFRADIVLGNFIVPGWSNLMPESEFINDGTVAITIALLLFLIPSKESKSFALMEWKDVQGIPWHIVLLFGGGFALAKGFVESGLSIWLGEQLVSLGSLPILFVIFGVVILMTFLTELTSNTATTEMILPVLAGLAVSIHVNPLILMLPATFAASLAFMLPVATPPNAIVFSTGHLKIKDMAFTGIYLNFISAIITTLGVYYWGSYVFNIQMDAFPLWAQ